MAAASHSPPKSRNLQVNKQRLNIRAVCVRLQRRVAVLLWVILLMELELIFSCACTFSDRRYPASHPASRLHAIQQNLC